MPYRSKKPCRYPGCPKLTDMRYCPEHERLESQRYEKYRRYPNHSMNYDESWRRTRERFLEEHPLCEMCQSEGRLIPAVLVHHKVRIADGGANEDENLMPLCEYHHSSLNAKEGDRWK